MEENKQKHWLISYDIIDVLRKGRKPLDDSITDDDIINEYNSMIIDAAHDECGFIKTVSAGDVIWLMSGVLRCEATFVASVTKVEMLDLYRCKIYYHDIVDVTGLSLFATNSSKKAIRIVTKIFSTDFVNVHTLLYRNVIHRNTWNTRMRDILNKCLDGIDSSKNDQEEIDCVKTMLVDVFTLFKFQVPGYIKNIKAPSHGYNDIFDNAFMVETMHIAPDEPLLDISESDTISDTSAAADLLLPAKPTTPQKPPNLDDIRFAPITGAGAIHPEVQGPLLYMDDIVTTPATSTPKTSNTKTKKTSIPKVMRERCWEKRNGRLLDGKCFCCGCALTINEFECGHVVAETLGGETSIANLEPICRTCTRSMGITNMLDFMKSIGKIH